MTSAPSRTRIAVLASGGGSNLGALLDHLDQLADDRHADVVLVATDNAAAGALVRASDRGITTAVLRTARGQVGEPVSTLLDPDRIDLVVLAGYLRLVPTEVVQRFRGSMLNVHPALLPSFGGPGMYGRRVHAAVLSSGATVSGPTVHFVDEEYDRGPIIAQWPVPVCASDTVDTLAARVLRAEHRLLPRVVEAVAAGAIRLSADGRVERPASVPDDAAYDLVLEPDQHLADPVTRGVSRLLGL